MTTHDDDSRFRVRISRPQFSIEFDAPTIDEIEETLRDNRESLEKSFQTGREITEGVSHEDAGSSDGEQAETTTAPTRRRGRRSNAEKAAAAATSAPPPVAQPLPNPSVAAAPIAPPATASAPAPAPIPGTAPTAPAAPAAPSPAAQVAAAADAGTIPPFLDRKNPNAAANVPTAVPAPPPIPSPSVVPPAAPPTGVLAPKIVAELEKRTGGDAGQEKAWADWLAQNGIVVPGMNYKDAVAAVLFVSDEKLGPIAGALQIAA